MFDKKNKIAAADPFSKMNRIAEGTVIKGNISSQADFRIDGELIGNFKSTGKLVIGITGKIMGDVFCVNADIEGKFIGKIEVSEVLNVRSKGDVKGDVVVSKLSIESGARFNTTSCSTKDRDNDNVKSFNLNEIEKPKEIEKLKEKTT